MTDFEAVYRANFSEVYRYLCALTGDSQTAEELTSETFFRAMEQLDRFRGECRLSTWLCQIGRNCYLSSLRRPPSVPPEEAPELPDPAPGPEELKMPAGSTALCIVWRSPTRRSFPCGFSASCPSGKSAHSLEKAKTGPASPITGRGRKFSGNWRNCHERTL